MAIFLKLLGNGRDGDQISISPAAEVFMCHQMGHMASRRLKTALAMNDVLWQNLYFQYFLSLLQSLCHSRQVTNQSFH